MGPSSYRFSAEDFVDVNANKINGSTHMVLASRLTQLLNFDADVGENAWCERSLRDCRVVSPTVRMHHYPPVKIISRPLTTNTNS